MYLFIDLKNNNQKIDEEINKVGVGGVNSSSWLSDPCTAKKKTQHTAAQKEGVINSAPLKEVRVGDEHPSGFQAAHRRGELHLLCVVIIVMGIVIGLLCGDDVRRGEWACT